ncbi:MAG: S8 family serine peptidase [Defluviitaleaceae bacterium]|nr:S8 family serine peptidase [Defluviitaleaceae bacterium]
MIIEIIVKYNDDIAAAAAGLSTSVEILSPNFAIITLDESNLAHIAELPQIEYIEPPKGLSLFTTESLYHACIPSAVESYGLSGKGVLIGCIDSGLDYTHPDFQNDDDTTRILYFWDMTATGAPPAGFKDGHLFAADDFNKALQSPNPLSIIPQLDAMGHGTAVAGVACGNGRASGGLQKGVAFEAGIIAVKLGGGARTTQLMRALKFIVDTAQNSNAPCAINISFGTNEGGHDGNSLFEQYINEIAQRGKISIIAAAGNEGSAGHHFFGNIPTGQSENIEFTVGGNLRSLYLVISKDFVDEFTFELIPPVLNGVKISTNLGLPTFYNTYQEIYIRAIATTKAPLPQGFWHLKITSASSVVGDFNIWLPTAEEVGAATTFARPNPEATITLPATAAGVVSVGAYNAPQDAFAEFSGRGFTNQTPQKPDIVAPGVNVLSSAPGGGYDNFTGTSIAAPFVTGAAALMMEWGIIKGDDPYLYGQKVKAFLHLGANRRTDRQYPNEIWGYGTLCLKSSLEYLEKYRR